MIIPAQDLQNMSVKTNEWLDKILPHKPLTEKQRRNIPLIERTCLILGAGEVGYGVYGLEHGFVNNWNIAYIVIGFMLVIMAALLWRRQIKDAEKKS